MNKHTLKWKYRRSLHIPCGCGPGGGDLGHERWCNGDEWYYQDDWHYWWKRLQRWWSALRLKVRYR